MCRSLDRPRSDNRSSCSGRSSFCKVPETDDKSEFTFLVSSIL